MKGTAKRLALETLGWLLLVVGIAALVLPGPGLLGVFAGLALLSQQYDWAERRTEPVKLRALKAAAEGVATPLRLLVSVAGVFVLMGFGVLWSVRPPAPDWWPFGDAWWLPGGLGTGLTQIISGFIALSLIGYSYHRFRGHPDAVTDLDAAIKAADEANRTARTHRRRDADRI